MARASGRPEASALVLLIHQPIIWYQRHRPRQQLGHVRIQQVSSQLRRPPGFVWQSALWTSATDPPKPRSHV